MQNNLRKIIYVILGTLIVLSFFSPQDFIANWWWFKANDALSVFEKIIFTKIIVFIAFFSLVFIFALLNYLILKKTTPNIPFKVTDSLFEIRLKQNLPQSTTLIIVSAITIFSIILATDAASRYDLFLKFFNAVPFAVQDPIFHKNISFYVFALPLYEFLYQELIFLVAIAFIGSLFLYIAMGNLAITKRGIILIGQAKFHLGILACFLFIMKAIGYKLSQYQILFDSKSSFYGAGYADIYAYLPALKILFILSLIGAVTAIIAVITQRFLTLILIALGLIIISFVGTGIYPQAIQKLKVAPNEIEKEKKFIALNIKYTREAFNLANITENYFNVKENLTPEILKKNKATVENIRLWDYKPLLSTYSQLQEIRTYYKFNDIDVDRYLINNKYQQVMLSAREMDYENLPNANWINKHLIYTHGYGMVMNPVTQISEEGLPIFYIKDIPPKTSINLEVKYPQIYFGENTASYALVNTKNKEFDYAAKDENIYTNYQGKGGILLNSFFKKLIFSIKLKEAKILLSPDITHQSKLLYNRDVLNLIDKIAPFILYDPDPYLVLANSKLYWIIDGYTFSNYYPYSIPSYVTETQTVNYLRNSVKVVVDAYNGKANFYIADEKDPIILSYKKMFPRIFLPLDKMPKELRKHLRYPLTYFYVQAKKLLLYHITDPKIFYSKEDLWNTPQELFQEQQQEMEPYYNIMKLPDFDKEEFVLILPFTPASKKNLTTYLVARNDDKNYGKLILYKFPKEKLTYGPMQVENRIDQDPEISKLFSLWGQRGSQVIRGNLLIIPIQENIIYVEPVYLQAEQGQIPELKRVIVVYGNKIAIGNTLSESLEKIFGQNLFTTKSTTKTIKKDTTIIDLINTTFTTYAQAKANLQKGKFAEFGKNFEDLGNSLNHMQKIIKDEVKKIKTND